MTEEAKNRPGAPPGNQNARKHGFYSDVLNEVQQQDLEQAVDVEGLDDEIAFLRVKIKALAREHPENVGLMVKAINSMARLLTLRCSISKNDKAGLKDAIVNILKDVALPVGVSVANILKK